MNKIFKVCFYMLLGGLIILFFTKDINFYKNVKNVENPNDLLVLVNKNNKLDSNFVPNNLELIDIKYSNENKYLKREARINFEKLSKEALEQGYKIVAVSTYRDYNYQKKLYEYYVEKYGKEYADDCSAYPGYSEHQTGLAVDVMGSNNDYDLFEQSREFEWMLNNSYKFGFILRYPKEKQNITGFKYEPWHYRYVGEDVSKIIFNNKLTLEEYKKGDY